LTRKKGDEYTASGKNMGPEVNAINTLDQQNEKEEK
jgi:hypothetical protein